jgi:hypothetical protein
MASNERIIAVADCLERLYFFNRMPWIDAIVVDAFQIKLIGGLIRSKLNYITSRAFQNEAIPVSLLKRIQERNDYRNNLHTDQQIISTLNYLKKCDPKTVLLFNDSLKHNPIWVEICRYLDIEIYTIEISNFPGKMQISTTGVNGNFTPLVGMGNTNISKDDWIKQKRSYHPDRLGMYSKVISIFVRLYSKIKNRNLSHAKTDYIPHDKNDQSAILKQYSGQDIIFFAQLASDTNLQVHYDGNQQDIINFLTKNQAMFSACKIVYHPLSWERKVGMGENISIYDVPKKYTVFTINSTVALEAILAGLSVQTFGKSILNSFPEKNSKYIVKYLNSYCIDVEYFEKTEIPKFI